MLTSFRVSDRFFLPREERRKILGRRKSTRIYDPGFGLFFRKARTKNLPHLSGRQVAKRLGISSPYFFDIENGKVPPPSREIVEEMAELVGIDKNLLLNLAGYGQHVISLVPPFENMRMGRPILPQSVLDILAEVLAEEGTSLTPDNMESVLCGFLSSKNCEHARHEVAKRIKRITKDKES